MQSSRERPLIHERKTPQRSPPTAVPQMKKTPPHPSTLPLICHLVIGIHDAARVHQDGFLCFDEIWSALLHEWSVELNTPQDVLMTRPSLSVSKAMKLMSVQEERMVYTNFQQMVAKSKVIQERGSSLNSSYGVNGTIFAWGHICGSVLYSQSGNPEFVYKGQLPPWNVIPHGNSSVSWYPSWHSRSINSSSFERHPDSFSLEELPLDIPSPISPILKKPDDEVSSLSL